MNVTLKLFILILYKETIAYIAWEVFPLSFYSFISENSGLNQFVIELVVIYGRR